MQRLVWPLRNALESYTPDGYQIQQRSLVCQDPSTEVVIARRFDNNHKSMWVVYTRVLSEGPDRSIGVWTYVDGLEFRSMASRALLSYKERVTRMADSDPARVAGLVSGHE
jgi:hypothetical protein